MAHESNTMTLLPQIWSWYYGFCISMGLILSAAIAFSFAVLSTHWLYLCARRIESKPTSPSFSTTLIRLSGFQALVAGAVIVPFGTITLYYILFLLVWKLSPSMPTVAEEISNVVPSLVPESTDQWLSSMATLVICLGGLAVLVVGSAVIFLHDYAKRMSEVMGSINFVKKLVRRYFYDSLLIGILLAVIACPVFLYFLYNVALLVMILKPSTAQYLRHMAFPGALDIYKRSAEILGSWLLVILMIPALWLLLRGLRLRIRYTIENLTMKTIFVRGVKFSCLGFFGGTGCIIMYFLADCLFRLFVHAAFR
jgi:hypothetical protein